MAATPLVAPETLTSSLGCSGWAGPSYPRGGFALSFLLLPSFPEVSLFTEVNSRTGRPETHLLVPPSP